MLCTCNDCGYQNEDQDAMTKHVQANHERNSIIAGVYTIFDEGVEVDRIFVYAKTIKSVMKRVRERANLE